MLDFRKKKIKIILFVTPCVLIIYHIVYDAEVNGRSESVVHLMPKSMVSRLDPLLSALFNNSYGIINLLKWE